MLSLQVFLISSILSIISVTSTSSLTDHKLPIQFTEHPQSQTSHPGSTVVFRCLYQANNKLQTETPQLDSGISITWLFNMQPLTPSKQYKIKRNRLIITGYKPRLNSGQYRCILNNTLFSPPFVIVSEPATLSAASIDDFTGHTSNKINLSIGNVAIISCNLPQSNPPAIPIFYHNNNEITHNHSRFRVFSSGNLQINNVQETDSGVYRCSARNPATNNIRVSSSQTTLKVYEPFGTKLPEIVYVPSGTNRVKIGANLTLECVANGAPVPLVSWEKFGGILPPERSKQIFGNLLLFNVQPEDKGTYVCRAEIGPGEATFKTSMVDVFSPPEIDPSAASGLVVTATEGQSLELTCPVHSRPRSHVTWFYQGRQVTNDKVYTQKALGDKSVLFIRHFRASESTGVFQCFAVNEYGSRQVDLLVVPAEKRAPVAIGLKKEVVAASEKPVIIMGPQDAQIYEGQTVVLLCITNQQSGKSQTQINWLHNENIIEPTLMRRFEINQLLGNLRIVSVQKSDAGVYKCIASNRHGMSTAQARVNVMSSDSAGVNSDPNSAGVNSDPNNAEVLSDPVRKEQHKASRPSIKQIGSKNILLNWQVIDSVTGMVITSPATLANIAYFKVEYRTAQMVKKGANSPPANTWLTINEQIDANKREYILTDLKKFETYRFRIATFYVNGNIVNSHASLRFRLENTWTMQTTPQTPGDDFHLSKLYVQVTQVWAIASSSLGLRWTIKTPTRTNMNTIPTKMDGFYIYYRKISNQVTNDNEINTQTIPRVPITNYTRIKVALDATRAPIDSFMIENLAESSLYEIKMSCYNLIGDLCTLSPPLYGITQQTSPANPQPTQQTPSVIAEPTKNTNFLFIVLGSVLAFLTIVLTVFIIMCIIRHRQHKRLLAQLHNTSQKMTSSSCPTLIYEDSLRQSSRANYATKLLEANVFSNNTNDSNSTNSQSMSTTTSSMVTPPHLDSTAQLLNGQNMPPAPPQVPPPQIYGMNLNINPLNNYFDHHQNLLTSPMKQSNNQENFYHTLSALGNLPPHQRDPESNQYAEYHNTTLNIRAHLLLQQQQQQQQQFLINTLKSINMKHQQHQQNYMTVNLDPKSPASCSIKRNTSITSSKRSKKSLRREQKSEPAVELPPNLSNYYLLPRPNQQQQDLNDIDLLNIEAALGQGLFNNTANTAQNPAALYLLNNYLQTNSQNTFQAVNSQMNNCNESEPLMFNNVEQEQMSSEPKETEPLKSLE